MLGSLCLELGGGKSRQVPSRGTWQAGHTVGIQGSALDSQGALPAGLLQSWFRGAEEPGLGRSVLGGLVWPSGAAIWLQSGPLLTVVPPSQASSNEQLCAPLRYFCVMRLFAVHQNPALFPETPLVCLPLDIQVAFCSLGAVGIRVIEWFELENT